MSATLHPPIPTRASKSRVTGYAESMRSKLGVSTGFDLAELIERNSGQIEYFGPFDDDQVDAIVVQPDESFVIRLSSLTGPLRDNFTMAHELGHLLLHWAKVKKNHPGDGMRATRQVDKDNQDLVRCEWEANWFAAGLLMPTEKMREMRTESPSTIASALGVSESAVNIRLKSLGVG